MPLWTRSVRASRILARLQDERGIALIMAIGIMFVLTITVSSVMVYTAASARHANNSNAGQKAYALAEAGVNNAVAVLNASYYPGHRRVPGRPDVAAPRTTTYDTGTVTWSGTLVGPLGLQRPWRWEWRITSTGTVKNPTGPSAPRPVTRTATAVVPVVIPTTTPASATGPLNFLYSGTDMWFQNSVHVKAPVYATRDLHLESTARDRRSGAEGRSRPRPLPEEPAEPDWPHGGSDPRIAEVHVVRQCSSKADPDAAHLRAVDGQLGRRQDLRDDPRQRDPAGPPPFISYIPKLTCCAPYGGTIAPAGRPPAPDNPSNMGFWYQNADLGPFAPCTTSDAARRRRSTPRAGRRQLDQLERHADARRST